MASWPWERRCSEGFEVRIHIPCCAPHRTLTRTPRLSPQVADIWSLGIILFAMLFGAFPFKGRDRRYIQAVLLGQYAIPPNIPVRCGAQG